MAHNGEGQNQWKYGQEASEYGSSGTGLNAGGGYGDSSQRLVSFFWRLWPRLVSLRGVRVTCRPQCGSPSSPCLVV